MKIKLLFLSLSLVTLNFSVSAQKNVVDKSNCRDGENVEYCRQHTMHNKLMQNPAYVQSLAQDELIRKQESKNNDAPKGTIYKIPVVFHVLHNGGNENISDDQIQDAMDILNRDYRKLNADANSVNSDFTGMPADVEIEFVLATKAPNGTCFKGITRTASAMSFQGANGDQQVDAIVSGNNVYNGQWAGNRYMNIFVCGDIGGAAGYTYKPSGWIGTSMYNGIWILHNYVGSIGTGSIGTSRALTHEVGHWLNLDHTWGGNNNPGNASSCGSDDAVQDTPNCIGVTSCNINSNTCNSDDGYWGFAIKDNVENYMDYSYCSKMYTQGQVNRMRNAIVSSVGGRNNLWTTTNLTNTGADGNLYLCKADFTSNKTSVCAGGSVEFYDESYNAVNGWTWSFPSGTPSTSNAQNPVVTYSTPGVYTVTLNATDGSTNSSETKTAYIHVLPAAATLPFHESFESYTTLSNLPNWEVVNVNNNNAFVLETTTSYTGSKCVKLQNYGQSGTNIDELVASPVDLSGVASNGGVVTLSFRYAYRKRTSGDYEWLKVFITKDCGDNWVQRKTIGGSQLSSIAVASSWKPTTQSDWTTVHMTNITSDYWVNNFNYKFRFDGSNGNNIYLDDINIYLGSPSDNIVSGIDELSAIETMTIYPNPTEGDLNIEFNVDNAQDAKIVIQDVYGKTIEQQLIHAAQGNNLVLMDTNKFAAGVYFVNVQIGTAQKVMQFIVK